MNRDYWDRPAFPASSASIPHNQKGLTKREWMASMVLQGMLSNSINEYNSVESFIEIAIETSESLMQALEK